MMKLTEYAKQCGVSYKTAWRWWKAGHLKGYQLPTGTILISNIDPSIQLDKQEKDEKNI